MAKSLSTDKSNHHNLDSLPDDVYHYGLFDFLDLDDVLRLRLVSKSLYSKVKTYRITELHFHSLNHHKIKTNWLSTTKSTKFRSQIGISNLKLLHSPSSNNLIGLRRLKIEDCPHSFELEDLNQFTKLRILEISGLVLNWDCRLRLPDLRALSIHLDTSTLPPRIIEVDAANLHSLKTNVSLFHKMLKFENYSSVKHISVPSITRSLLKFDFLEFLEIDKLEHLDESKSLSKLKSLKKLRINSFESLKKLVESKLEDSLEVVLYGVKTKGINLDVYRKDLDFQWDRYFDLENDLNFIKSMDYDRLIGLLGDTQPSNLFSKYNNIQNLKVGSSNLKNAGRLLDFIGGCPNLTSLTIDQTSFGVKFYCKLPSVSSLSALYIYDENHLSIDFGFIMEMPYLTNFETDQDVLMSEDLNLNDLKYLKRFQFGINSCSRKNKNAKADLAFFVYKKATDKFKVSAVDSVKQYRHYKELELPHEDFFSFNKLVSWSNNVRKYKKPAI